MLRKFVLLLFLICLVLLSATMVSCGGSSYSGGGGGGGGCTGGPYNVVGDWMLTVSGVGVSLSGPGVINSAGLAVFFQTTAVPAPGDTVVLPTITGTCSFSGSSTAYATPGTGGGSVTDTVQGKVNSSTSITGTISNGNTFSLARNSALSGSVTALSGSMIGAIKGTVVPSNWFVSLSPTGIGASMTVSGSDNQGCSASGTFNQEGSNVANLNVFDVSINFTGSNCPLTALNGLGFESNSDYLGVGGGSGIDLYAVSSSGASVFEIVP